MRAFIERPIATAMLYLALALLGVYSFLHTPLELAPKEDFPSVTVSTSWPGVPPEVVQTQVTAPLEEMAATVKGVSKITSTSAIGSSRIDIEFLVRTNMEFAVLELTERLARLRDELPYNVRPQVQPYIPEDFRVEPCFVCSISGDYPLQSLYESVKERLEYGLGAIKGVADVSVYGGSEPEIRIEVDQAKIDALGLHPYQISMALNERARTLPAGRVRSGGQEYIFRVAGALPDVAAIRDAVVATSGGIPIRISDVARVVPSYRDVYRMERINGQPTIQMRVAKESGSSTLQVTRAIKRRLEELKPLLPAGLVFRVTNDESEEIERNLRDLYILAGIIMAVIFGLVFVMLRRLRPSLLILSSVAFSVVITFNLIYLLRISMNMLTLGALALAFGLLVDNAIVVFENILRLREEGVPAGEAVLRAPREVFVPVLASTLTTICVYFTFPYFQGRLKLFYFPLAMVVTSALLISLFVAFTLIPALSRTLLKPRRVEAPGERGRRFTRVLRVAVRHPLVVLALVALALYGSHRWFKSEVPIGDWFRFTSQQKLSIGITMPSGTEISRTDDLAAQFERLAMDKPYEKEISTSVQTERASLLIAFPPEIERSYFPYALKEELIQLATQFAGVSISVYGFDPQGYYSSMSAGTFYDSRIQFFGYNLQKLSELTAELETLLKRNPRIKDVKITSSRYGWWGGAQSVEHVLNLDRDAMARFRIDPAYLYFGLQTMIRGEMGSPLRIRMEGREFPVTIKLPDAETMDIGELLGQLIRTPNGELLRVGDIATVEERPIAGSIDREDQQFQQTVSWEFRGPAKASENYRKGVFADLSLPPGFKASMDTGFRMLESEVKQITFAIAMALVIITMILAALFESVLRAFYVLLSVPLGLIGVFVAFVVSDMSFDSSAYIGVIMLCGIVVNNATLLVDHIDRLKRSGIGLLEAVVRGARDRVRPVFMTASTTVLGIVPMILYQSERGQNKIWSSLSLCLAGGLVTSTLLILIVIPIFYYHGERLIGWGRDRAAEVRRLRARLAVPPDRPTPEGR